MDKVRFGVIGIGNMGTAHVESLGDGHIDRAVLTAVCDIKPERMDKVREKYGDKVAYFTDYHEMLKSGLVDAVHIATPHYLHPTIAIDAFAAGVNVLSEKPAGVYTKAVREMNEAAQKSGLLFGIMFNQRTNPVYRKAREMVQNGELGELKRLVWIITNWYRTQAYYDSGDWRATWAGEGGGVLTNQCPHNLDLWQWICGMPTKVRAFCKEGKWHDIEVEDDVTAYVEYANGATGVFITTTGDCPGTNRFEVTLDGGKLVVENNELYMYKLEMFEQDFSRTWKNGFGTPKCEKIKVETDGFNPQHVEVLRAFAAHIMNGEPLVASGVEGIRGLTLANAMYLSSWTGETVELPLDEDRFLEELNKRRATSRRKEDVSITLDTEGTYGSKAK